MQAAMRLLSQCSPLAARASSSAAGCWTASRRLAGSLQAAHCQQQQHPQQHQRSVSCDAAARLGDSLQDVDTPALLVDLDVFEQNCLKLASVMQQYPSVAIRPHAKAHKCPQLAQLQLQLLGPAAVGMCCQKVSEAEAMVAGGVMDVFVSNEVVAQRKLTRLVSLAAQGARVSVVVDAAEPLEQLAATAAAWGVSINVLVEINAGQDRCGVDTPEQAAQLAERVANLSAQHRGAVSFTGIQAYHGGLQHVRDPAARASRVSKVVDKAAAAVDAIQQHAGLQCQVVTGGGSGTYRIEAASGVFTEVQPGSFCFGDADYAQNVQEDGNCGEWQQSLWVLTQVMSVSQARACAVVDAGMKALSLDSGPPQLLESPNVAAGLLAPPPGATTTSSLPSMSFEGVAFENGGDEHGKLLWPQGNWQAGTADLPPLGTKLLLQPGHCDPTANLYPHILAFRRHLGIVGVWPVAARGPGV